ncbi:hypothetical protein [Pseudomonas sp. M30-35]|uniref:hypothetical protein n=1 Tax=Pseudomonas sp. M30-35 TaxID=1981174 RepID=UPI000B3C12F4|nr:hypothetical protein [Pseudomonas sp. M30-35]ARU90448.1 hypothetical protein B9K09_21925 [Pseudomonas sp. M30-35]
MNDYVKNAPTNQEPGSVSQIPGYLMPARAFFYVVVDEVGADGFLVRKIYTPSTSPYLKEMNLAPLQELSELTPERYGMMPKNAAAPYSIAEHVMGGGRNVSSYISTSSIFPQGSPRFDGRSVFIDIKKSKASGLKLVSTREIIDELNAYKTQHPHLEKRVTQIANYVENIDKEVLLHGEKVPASAIFNEDSLRNTQLLTRTARATQVLGIVLTAYDLNNATQESIALGSAKPIEAELVRQAGGWGAAYAGAKLGGVVGAAVGIETGPGAIITGLVGGIVGGVAGYFGADWVADHIYEN